MSFTPFLNAVAASLMLCVRPAVLDERSRDALEACVRAVAGMAAALAVPSEAELAALLLPPDCCPPDNVVLVSSPPENLAANDQSASRLAVAAAWLARGDWLLDGAEAVRGRSMLGWERDILQAKIASLAALEGNGGIDLAVDLGNLMINREALERYFAERRCGPAKARITAFRQTIGGRSRQTAVFTLETDGAPPRDLVVQRDHPAGISGFGVEGQYPILEVVARSGLKTSLPVLLETDPSVLGAPFMLLEQAPGTVAGADYFNPPNSPPLARELAEQLAILHRIDPAPLLGRINVTVDPTDDLGWHKDLARIEESWLRFSHAPSLTVAASLAWMRSHVAAISSVSAIIHNDAAFHNILTVDGRFSALLDWELVHVGHPAEDLGYCRAFVQEIMPWQEFMKAYIDAGGDVFSAEVIDYFSLRAGIHLLTLLQYGRSMFIAGVTSDINLAEAATSFIPKHHGRIATMLHAILSG